ncbi:MAG: hypothetical protein R3F53_10755 [Gammaproteobacteria bacterium]
MAIGVVYERLVHSKVLFSARGASRDNQALPNSKANLKENQQPVKLVLLVNEAELGYLHEQARRHSLFNQSQQPLWKYHQVVIARQLGLYQLGRVFTHGDHIAVPINGPAHPSLYSFHGRSRQLSIKLQTELKSQFDRNNASPVGQ